MSGVRVAMSASPVGVAGGMTNPPSGLAWALARLSPAVPVQEIETVVVPGTTPVMEVGPALPSKVQVTLGWADAGTTAVLTARNPAASDIESAVNTTRRTTSPLLRMLPPLRKHRRRLSQRTPSRPVAVTVCGETDPLHHRETNSGGLRSNSDAAW